MGVEQGWKLPYSNITLYIVPACAWILGGAALPPTCAAAAARQSLDEPRHLAGQTLLKAALA